MFDPNFCSSASRWPLVRISSGGRTSVILLQTTMLPLSVHWVGRSMLCPQAACALCNILPVRGLFYLPVSCNGRASILELGAMSSSHLEQHCKLLHGGVRPGLEVDLTRRGAKSPVHSEVVGFRPGCVSVEMIEFIGRVMALYHLPSANPNETIAAYEARLLHQVIGRAKHEAARLEESQNRRV